MTVAFISDLHLSADRPDIEARFLAFMETEAPRLTGLYILGDLFEYWIGDDASHKLGHDVVEKQLQRLTDSGVPVYLMHGNRDFLLGEGFFRQTGCRLLPDPSIIDLFGHHVLLSHGDAMCSEDIAHQAFRNMVLNPDWQQSFLKKSINERQAVAKQARYQSEQGKQIKSMEIMDVSEDTVRSSMREHNTNLLLHGHTHRPAIHRFRLNGKSAARIVLGDWFTQESVLLADESGLTLQPENQRIEFTELSG